MKEPKDFYKAQDHNAFKILCGILELVHLQFTTDCTRMKRTINLNAGKGKGMQDNNNLERYIFEKHKGLLQPFTVKTGYISPYGNESVKTEDTSVEIDIHKFRTIRFVESKDNMIFAF